MPPKKRKLVYNDNVSEKSYRQYSDRDLVEAARLVTENNFSIYAAAKSKTVPWSSLKRFLENSRENNNQSKFSKLGRPFALSVELEQQLVRYINDMQELGFGLTVLQVRKISFQLAQSANREHYLSQSGMASKVWWASFKKRYGLSLRIPENLSAYRSSMANPTMIKDFYSKLEQLIKQLNILPDDLPSSLWNCDETGLAYVVKPNRIIAQIGKRFVYKRTYAERGETHTVMGCVCANGSWIPPLIIFKGERWNDRLKEGSLPNSLVRISKKGWINSQLFIEWFQHFIDSIPKKPRPVILLMDSHASHLSPTVLTMARENGIYLFTFPAHTSHLLQPLDVGVYRPLKSNWSKVLNKYMEDNPNDKPNRYNFHTLFNEAFISTFSINTIKNSFKKAGIFPFNANAIPEEALRPSQLTERALESLENEQEGPRTTPASTTSSSPSLSINDTILKLPHAVRKTMTTSHRKRDSSAKCLTPPVCSPSTSLQASTSKLLDQDEDWTCAVCHKTYSQDVKKKTGAKWIQCSFCRCTYHFDCQRSDVDEDEDIYMCDLCHLNESDSD